MRAHTCGEHRRIAVGIIQGRQGSAATSAALSLFDVSALVRTLVMLDSEPSGHARAEPPRSGSVKEGTNSWEFSEVSWDSAALASAAPAPPQCRPAAGYVVGAEGRVFAWPA